MAASTSEGVWNETPAVLRFRVLPAWYQTLWFRAGVVLSILAVGAAAAWLVQRQRQHQMQREYRAMLAERTRVAGEMHDTLLSAFTGVTIQLQAVRRRMLTAPHEAEQDLGRTLDVADVALRDARSAVWDMRAPELEQCDVAEAIENSAREAVASHQTISGVPIALEVTVTGDRKRLAPAVEACAFRIGREAVANAIRHAMAKRICIAIAFESEHLRVEVRDDGIGFDVTHLQPTEGRGHWGLVGMRERARTVRGTLDVSSMPGSGTAVVLRVPPSHA